MVSKTALEEAVLCLLCFNPSYATQFAARVSKNLFSNRTHQRLAEVAIEFIQSYGTCPGESLELLLETDFRRGEEGKLLGQTVDLLKKNAPEVNAQFILKELDRFIQIQTMSEALQRASDLLQEGDVDKAREAVYKSSSYALSGSEGIWLKNPRQMFKFLDLHEQNEYFPIGIPTIDSRGIKPERKTLTFMIAPPGAGKSWWLTEVGKGAIQHHHKVLHIALEISEEKQAMRYLQAIFSLTKLEAQSVKVPYFETDESGKNSLQFRELSRDPVFKKRNEITQRLLNMTSFPDLHIKEFPTATLSIEQLYMYLETLEKTHGFVPDLIIVDYADLMRISSENLRTDTGRIYRELRGVGVSRNAAMVTASQSNREGIEAKLITALHSAEDISKIGTADIVITYNQTAQERLLNLARIYVQKGRDEKDKFLVLISQAYACGQFCLDSIPMNVDMVGAIDQAAG